MLRSSLAFSSQPLNLPTPVKASKAKEIANETSFLEEEEFAYVGEDLDRSTSSMTGALLAAHRKNKFLEEELRREKQERKAIASTVETLQHAVEEIHRETGTTPSSTPAADPSSTQNRTQDDQYATSVLNQTQESIRLLESRAMQAETIAADLQGQLARATDSLRDHKDMATVERQNLLKDIAVLTSSTAVINDVSTTLHVNDTNFKDKSGHQYPPSSTEQPPTFITGGSQRETIAARIALQLHSALSQTNTITPSETTAKACVDAALACIDTVAGFSVMFSNSEESVKASRDRLAALNEKLKSEGEVRRRVYGIPTSVSKISIRTEPYSLLSRFLLLVSLPRRCRFLVAAPEDYRRGGEQVFGH